MKIVLYTENGKPLAILKVKREVALMLERRAERVDVVLPYPTSVIAWMVDIQSRRFTYGTIELPMLYLNEEDSKIIMTLSKKGRACVIDRIQGLLNAL